MPASRSAEMTVRRNLTAKNAPSASPDPAGHPPDQQPRSNGQAREFAPLKYLGWATFAVMSAAAIGMLITS